MLNKKAIREVLDISLPAVGEASVYTIMSLIDTMIIGNFGGNIAVSAVGISYEILYSCVNIFISVGICIGITSFVSRSIGARQYNTAEIYASLGFFMGFIMSSIICFVLNCFSERILIMAGANGKILEISNQFIKIMIIAIFFNMLTNIINSILRGYGNTYVPFKISILISSIKVILDFILIFGVGISGKGILGAAIASVFSEGIGFMFLYFYLTYKSKVSIKLKYILNLNVNRAKELIMLSVPSTMEDAAFSVSRLLCTFIIMRSGTIAFAANQIANTVESISFMPGMGFGVAVTTLVGIKVGEGNYKEAKEYTYTCAHAAVIMMVFFSAVFIFMPTFLVDLFVGDTEKKVAYIASLCLFIGAFEQPAIAISSVFAGALKGAGDTKSPFVISLLSSWLVRLPLTFYFIYILKFSIIYVWWITVIQWSFDAILMFIYFEKTLGFSA
jgi:putative MATE family efflux protein